MATRQELKADASTIKNATVVGENTATRVGTMFEDIIDDMAMDDDLTALQSDVNDKADASDLTALQTQVNGLPTWDETRYTFAKLVQIDGGTGLNIDPQDANVVILEGIGDNAPSMLNDGMAYFGTGTNKLYIKDGDGPSLQVSPSTRKLYYNSADGKLYRWTGSALEAITAESEGGGVDAAVKANINSLYASLSALYNALANIAFTNETAKTNAEPQAMVWPSVPQVSVTISTELEHAAIKRNGSIVGESISVDKGSDIVLTVEAGDGYTLENVTADHGTVTESGGVYTITWNNIQSNGTLTIGGDEEEIPVVMHTITYNLTGCTKSSGDTSVVSGEGLTAVLAKGEDWAAIGDFLASDILVTDGDNIPLVAGTDYTIAQASANGDITITFASVTSDINIMNIVFKQGYFNGATLDPTNVRSNYSDTYVPIPDGCTEISVHDQYSGTSANRSHQLYDADKANATQARSDGTGTTTFSVASDRKYIRFSISVWNGPVLNGGYIKDNTHDVYIWKGDNVQ